MTSMYHNSKTPKNQCFQIRKAKMKQLKLFFRSPITQSLALDILIWVIAIRMTRLRPGKDNNITKAMQYETIHCIQKKLPELLRTCFLYGERSVAHKCVKIVLLCSEYVFVYQSFIMIQTNSKAYNIILYFYFNVSLGVWWTWTTRRTHSKTPC